jgi:hypothetical protein
MRLLIASTLLLAISPLLSADERLPVSTDAVLAHATFLADDTLQGRNTGSEGYAIAANYAAAQFRQYGLEPAGDEGTYLQNVSFVETRLIGSVIDILGGGKSVELNALEDYVAWGSPVASETAVTAPVVFAGFGIDAPELKHRDYARLDVKGRIVLLFNGAPASFPTDARAHYSSTRLKYEEAAKRGAVGVIRIRTKIDNAKYPWERYLSFADTPSYNWIDRDGEIENAFPKLKITGTLSPDGARKLAEAAGASYDAWMNGAESVKYKTDELPVELNVKTESMQARIGSPNVAALLRGSDPDLSNEYVIVSAHLDHVGIGPEIDGDRIYNGFYDNATGSAVVIELARVLSHAASRPSRSVIFLLVTGEERGLLGSDFFAQHPTVPKEGIVANVNIDMPLLLHDASDVIAYGAEHSSLGVVAENAAKANGFALTPDPDPAEVFFIRSDQYSFIRQGVPALYVDPGPGAFDGGDSGKEAASDFLRNHYHRPSDDTSRPFNKEAASRYIRMNAEIILGIANAEERPRWNKGDFFGVLFGGFGAK